ncbi:transposase, partial [Streptomyces spectabilis]
MSDQPGEFSNLRSSAPTACGTFPTCSGCPPGWEDQRWTLVRVGELIARIFGVDCSAAAVWRLLHRHGWSWQCPA